MELHRTPAESIKRRLRGTVLDTPTHMIVYTTQGPQEMNQQQKNHFEFLDGVLIARCSIPEQEKSSRNSSVGYLITVVARIHLSRHVYRPWS